jgi:hypothetical protein
MDRDDSWYARGHTTHEDQVLDVIKDYHYFAPAVLALRATQARYRTEAGPGRWEEPIEVADRASLPMQAVRMRMGALLIRLGLQLRGGLAVQPDATTAIVAVGG